MKVENNKWLICWEKGQWLKLNDKKQHKDQFILADLLLYFGFPSMLSKLIRLKWSTGWRQSCSFNL